jgi:hypothetical protein
MIFMITRTGIVSLKFKAGQVYRGKMPLPPDAAFYLWERHPAAKNDLCGRVIVGVASSRDLH